ncbi:uncharacterized protein LOC133803470 [Humulus lupulus]|uniref:uncharacterized protein LOC133803470 n=1 Tax=Humulus lupulus TaxID=3486 RepID=UPI002B40547B|nr:uncharacterized protein LOC133803470 [Humulus lupulus]
MANNPGKDTTLSGQVGSWRWLKSFQFNRERDSPGDARNVLLVVAALITAVTFQAGVNPPGGVWQDTNDNHTAGQAIYASQGSAFYVFLIANTLALSSAIMVIISLTYRFPLHFEVWFSTIAMIVTYASSIVAVTPEYVYFRFILIAAAGPLLARLLWELITTWRMSKNNLNLDC